MLHPNPFVSAFLSVPEFSWKNSLRRWLGFSRLVPDFIQNFSPLKGYELGRQLRENDVVVDAGAFPGDYALYAARQVGSGGRVIALEPDPANRAVLQRNIRSSGFANIEVVPYGLWDRSTTLTLDAQGVASTLSEAGGAHSIDVRPLDDILAELELPEITVLKMDIEGAELQALAGAGRTLDLCRYVCVASYHEVDGDTTAARVEAILRSHGLRSWTAYPRHLTTYGLRSQA